MESKTVWVIEQGQYSDYRVVGVFSSQANAKQIANAINAPEESGEYKSSETATVVEWPINPAVSELRQGYLPYLVVMQEDGTVERCAKQAIDDSTIKGEVRMWRRAKAPAFIGKGIPDALTTTVWAKDDAHAIKITNEHRARLIASGKWAND